MKLQFIHSECHNAPVEALQLLMAEVFIIRCTVCRAEAGSPGFEDVFAISTGLSGILTGYTSPERPVVHPWVTRALRGHKNWTVT